MERRKSRKGGEASGLWCLLGKGRGLGWDIKKKTGRTEKEVVSGGKSRNASNPLILRVGERKRKVGSSKKRKAEIGRLKKIWGD